MPSLLAGAVTLEICGLTGTAINFANIIALPLLLGVGVAFNIYHIMAWRFGKSGLLQSPLTRAAIFSAMTNAAAFGKHVFIDPSGHVEHGSDDGSPTTLHDGRCRAGSTGLAGPASSNQDALTVSSSACRSGMIRCE